MNKNTIQIIILAGGQGKRMGGDLPKALTVLGGLPMMSFVVDTATRFLEGKRPPVAVVSYKKDLIQDVFNDTLTYAYQEKPMGTGHAVLSAENVLKNDIQTVLILYADQPFVSKDTLEKLATVHSQSAKPLTIATAVIRDKELFEKQFYNFGRIIRNNNGEVDSIIEAKDATESQKEIREVNPAYFCCDKIWLFKELKKLENNNAQGEYYLTDIVHKAFDQFGAIPAIQIDEKEALGANTLHQLDFLELHCKK
jgi:bifunctional UDP-N-acetylglucosamine pyrophosphorylase/glucosamine-1-phosphate N-acetyltransferase